ncbi:trypsin-like peptidase domain-containing protein [Candidatus Uhrbacteria bacterium]|nr:trypsin-like peptidase domain-containing protein [Candidatus Uhrbacteria bacterium]
MDDPVAADSEPRRSVGRRTYGIAMFLMISAVIGLGFLVADLGPLQVAAPEPAKPRVEIGLAGKFLEDLPAPIKAGAAQTVVINKRGTGFVLQDDVVITAAHVVDYNEGGPALVNFSDDDERPGLIVRSPILHDTAIILVKCKADKALTLDERRLKADDQLRIAGFDFAIKDGVGYIMRYVRGASAIPDGHMTGAVSPMSTSLIALEDELRRHYKIPRLRALAPMVHPGNSGSPIFTLDGTVVGMAVIYQGTHGRTFMVPAKTIRAVLEDVGIEEEAGR